MTHRYNVTIYGEDAMPIAVVTAESLTSDGDKFVDAVREAVEPERESDE